MSLSLILDAPIPLLAEPGFHRQVTCRDLAAKGEPEDDTSYQNVFRDDTTQTVFLCPRQLQTDYLNTTQALPDIIRLDNMQVFSGNLSQNKIFEQPIGNNANPWIFHEPAGPTAFFPAAVNPFPDLAPGEDPGSPPSITSVPVPYDGAPGLMKVFSQFTDIVYEVPATMPPASSPPTPVVIGNTADGKWLCHSKERLDVNQALFFRWVVPDERVGFAVTYVFTIGQYALRIRDRFIEVFRDISANGDRSAWKFVQKAPMWHRSATNPQYAPGMAAAGAIAGHGFIHLRNLLWQPFRRNQVLLRSNAGHEMVLVTRPRPERLTDGSDWNIVRSDTLAVWVMTPSPGHFQIHKVSYGNLITHYKAPVFTLDYTPAVFTSPTVTLEKDSDYGSDLHVTLSRPPAYTITPTDADTCPAPTSNGTNQSTTYGVEIVMQSADNRHTPFFYAYTAEKDPTFTTRPTTPFTVGSDSSASYHLDHAHLSAGLHPGAGRLTLQLTDNTPDTLAPYYYRVAMPIQLKSGSTVVFEGWTDPNELTPLKEDTSIPRHLTICAVDRWKQMTRTWIRDLKDWSQQGHVTTVLQIMQRAGIDVSSAVVPPNTPTYNTVMDLGETTLEQTTTNVKKGWQPKHETAAEFVRRIAETFSGWDVGFYLDGTPFYLPRDWYTVSSPQPGGVVTFYSSTAANPAGPTFRDPVTIRPIEPEANQIWVTAGNSRDGTPMISPVYTDWASINNPNAVNYLGRIQQEIGDLPGTYTCKQLKCAARKIFDQVRRRRRLAEFKAEFVPALQVGHVCTVGSYGNFRIQSIEADMVHGSVAIATYTGELIELGYGLP